MERAAIAAEVEEVHHEVIVGPYPGARIDRQAQPAFFQRAKL
jgi:hypothetical protein